MAAPPQSALAATSKIVKSLLVFESVSCKKRYSQYRTLIRYKYLSSSDMISVDLDWHRAQRAWWLSRCKVFYLDCNYVNTWTCSRPVLHRACRLPHDNQTKTITDNLLNNNNNNNNNNSCAVITIRSEKTCFLCVFIVNLEIDTINYLVNLSSIRSGVYHCSTVLSWIFYYSHCDVGLLNMMIVKLVFYLFLCFE